jgi:Recombination endonuclease VII
MAHDTPEKKRVYQRAYRAANREKVNEAQRAWAAANPERARERYRKYYAANREKLIEQARDRNKKNPDRVRENNRRHRGLPEPLHPAPALCECCGNPPPTKWCLALDHCHVSGVFRGWLCINCNKAIGQLGDSIEGLMNAVSYLQRATEVKS